MKDLATTVTIRFSPNVTIIAKISGDFKDGQLEHWFVIDFIALWDLVRNDNFRLSKGNSLLSKIYEESEACRTALAERYAEVKSRLDAFCDTWESCYGLKTTGAIACVSCNQKEFC